MSEEKSDKKESAQGGSAGGGEEKKKIAVPEKFKSLVEQIEKLSVMDLVELVKILEEKFGVSAQAPQVVAATAASSEGSAEEEKSSFNVELSGVGSNKIAVIKVVREITEKGLKEAKDIVDSAPKVIKEEVAKEEAEEIKKKLEAVGAQVTLK